MYACFRKHSAVIGGVLAVYSLVLTVFGIYGYVRGGAEITRLTQQSKKLERALADAGATSRDLEHTIKAGSQQLQEVARTGERLGSTARTGSEIAEGIEHGLGEIVEQSERLTNRRLDDSGRVCFDATGRIGVGSTEIGAEQ